MARAIDSNRHKGHSRVALASSQRLLLGYVANALIGDLICHR